MSLQHLQSLIELEIQQLHLKKSPKNLFEPIDYILSLGGKRMRPILVLLAYSLQGKDVKDILRPALSVEVFHNFTLMHDDIMDHAPLRRGQPTVHEKWNQTVGILSGDAMMIEAYNLLLDIPSDLLPTVLQKFNRCALDVCAGQQLDMDFEARKNVTEAEYLEMIRLKTAVLLAWSLEFGGILARLDEDVQPQLFRLGINMGLAFQLMDDYLDTFGHPDTFGKKIGGDIRSGKKTFLMIKAFEMADEQQQQALEHWMNSPEKEAKVLKVTELFKTIGIQELTQQKVLTYQLEAIDILQALPGEDKEKALLLSYMEQLKKRVV